MSTFAERLAQAQEHFDQIRGGNSLRWPPPHPKNKAHDFRGTDRGPEELSAEEDFGFDVSGFLILRAVLSQGDLRRINEALDQNKMEPLRDLAAHPVAVRYVEQLCGLAYRVDRAPELVQAPEPGASGVLVGGGEPFNYSRAYIHQNNSRFTQGLKVVWALQSCPQHGAGLKLLPCSHNLNLPVPSAVACGDDTYLDAIGLSTRPDLHAGDLLIAAASLATGVVASADGLLASMPRLAACEYVAVQARPTDLRADQRAEEPWHGELSDVQRAALGHIDRPILSDGTLGPGPAAAHHPAGIPLRSDGTQCGEAPDPLEFFYWDLCGFLVVENVIDQDWLQALNRSVDANLHRANFEQRSKEAVEGSERMQGTGRPGFGNLHLLDPPDREPFLRTLGHPEVAKRLNWMMGAGWRAERGLGSLILTQAGGGGQALHGAGEPVYPWLNWWFYRYSNGRCHTPSINVAWQLHSVGDSEGGFVVVPGSHKARFPLVRQMLWYNHVCRAFQLSPRLNFVCPRVPLEPQPSSDSGDTPEGHKQVLHPRLPAGSVLFFMGGATTHGAWSWHSKLTRRVLLQNYGSKDVSNLEDLQRMESAPRDGSFVKDARL